MDNWFMVIISACSVAVAIWTFQRGKKTSIDKERLFAVVGPSFLIMEPYLYKNISDIEVQTAYRRALALIMHKSLLAGYSLSEYRLDCTDQYLYVSFCKQLDHEYDLLCRSVGIPIRSFNYRLFHKQIHGIWRWIAFFASVSLTGLWISAVVLAYTAFALSLLQKAWISKDFTQMLTALVVFSPFVVIVLCNLLDQYKR